jgi:hypothetical protein
MYDFQHTLLQIITRVRRRIKTSRIDLPSRERKTRPVGGIAGAVYNPSGVMAVLGCEIPARYRARWRLMVSRQSHFIFAKVDPYDSEYRLFFQDEARWPASIAADLEGLLKRGPTEACNGFSGLKAEWELHS